MFISIITLLTCWSVDFLIMQLYIHGEKFNQPIFHCNNISGLVEPVSCSQGLLNPVFFLFAILSPESRLLYSSLIWCTVMYVLQPEFCKMDIGSPRWPTQSPLFDTFI